MKDIYYLCYYNSPESQQQRISFPAANTKIDYIVSSLNDIGYSVDIVSASGSDGVQKYNAKTIDYPLNNRIHWFSSIGRKNIFIKVIDKLFMSIQLLWYFLKNTTADSVLIVYHSLGYMKLVSILRLIKKFKIVLEVEEVYSDVINDKKRKKKEIKFAQKADAFIFSTEYLNEAINTNGKPYIILYGTYRVQPKSDLFGYAKNEYFFDPNKIHCVYSGIIDRIKGGAITAINAAQYLPTDFHLHILGFGTPEAIADLKQIIFSLPSTGATVTFDGLLTGEEYCSFLQNCKIGLSTQNPIGAYNDSSFPSKILAYLSNGLNVVSARIPVVEHSAIGKCITYYDEPIPQAVADAIVKASKRFDEVPQKIVRDLDNQFHESLKHIFGSGK